MHVHIQYLSSRIGFILRAWPANFPSAFNAIESLSDAIGDDMMDGDGETEDRRTDKTDCEVDIWKGEGENPLYTPRDI
jgi:hypothetical protein